MQTSKRTLQTNIFFERGNHGRPCKCFRKGKWCNYKLVSKHGLYMKTVFLFETWKLPSPLLSSKAFHTRENGLMAARLAEAGLWGLEQRTLPPTSIPLPLLPASPATSRCPSGAHLRARLAPDDLEPWDASSHLLVYSLPASQTELFLRMKAGILESNPTDRTWALCFQTHLANISVNAFRKVL